MSGSSSRRRACTPTPAPAAGCSSTPIAWCGAEVRYDISLYAAADVLRALRDHEAVAADRRALAARALRDHDDPEVRRRLEGRPWRMSAVDQGPLTIIATLPFLKAVWALP